jgi:glucuronate isomerase
MKTFMDEDFLLSSKTAQILFFDYAKNLPIVDYHCHLSPAVIYENRAFEDISEVWLSGDHYKWRLMRDCGVDEYYITGNAPGKEKFKAFAAVLPYAVGNPIYHWAHLELSRYFDFNLPLSAETAEEAWEHCNSKLQTLKPRDIISMSNVEIICTTDDPTDDLKYHKLLAADESFPTRVLPAFRPDKVFNTDKSYFEKLSEVSNVAIKNTGDLKEALRRRIDYFAAAGSKAADLGLEEFDESQFDMITFLCSEYKARDWVCELHFGVKRNVNSRRFHTLGADTGFDTISPKPCMNSLPKLLESLERENNLPKMLLFSINPNDNTALNILAGCFPDKVQQGAAWWFNDTLDGMSSQLKSFAASHAFSTHIGMLTDSRSLLSFSRHEYFRRILCNILGGWVESGLYPADMKILGEIVRNICYNNACKFFGF